MDQNDDDIDPRGLIRESYRMDLTAQECRTILLDWALGLDPAGPDEIARLLARYGPENPDHPMTALLRAGAQAAGSPRGRRGGRRSR